MSVSVKNEGIINPIEIDPKFVIITGEMRWRSAKEAGLLTVPCKIIEIKPKERFLRQMHENIHELTMNDWDTAEGLKKTIGLLLPGGKSKGRPPKKFEEILAKEYGKSQQWVSEHLAILNQVGEVREALKKGKLDYTRLRIFTNAPKEHKDWIKGLSLDKSISREAARNIASNLNRVTKEGREDIVKKIKDTNWSGKKGFEIAGMLHEIAPLRIESVDEANKLVQKLVIQLIELLEEYPLEFFGSLASVSVIPLIMRLGNFLNEYLKGKIKLN